MELSLASRLLERDQLGAREQQQANYHSYHHPQRQLSSRRHSAPVRSTSCVFKTVIQRNSVKRRAEKKCSVSMAVCIPNRGRTALSLPPGPSQFRFHAMQRTPVVWSAYHNKSHSSEVVVQDLGKRQVVGKSSTFGKFDSRRRKLRRHHKSAATANAHSD